MKKCLMVLLFLTMPSLVFGLAIEYMRNGECYLLIGHSDVNFRGVYRLNNPAGEPDGNPVGQKLFDPKTSYGISVNLERKVYTFSENKAPTFTLGNWPLRRLLKAPGGVSLWGAHCDTRKSYYVSNENLTYNQSNRPVYTTTGPMGSHNTLNPPSNDPQNVAWVHWNTGVVRPTIKESNRWYFQKTAVYCDQNCIYTNGYGDAFWLYFVPVDGSGHGNVPNNSWWQSRDPDPAGRPGNLFYWDRVYRKYTYYDLNMWNKPMGIWSVGNPIYGQYAGVADSIYDEIIQRSRISACLNCVCVNGSGDQNFSAVPKFVSLAMSPFGRMYLYTRTDHPSANDGEIRLNGTAMDPTAGNIRGNVNDPTTKWVGISAASKTQEYIYLLGTNLIRAWLEQYNIKPPALNITSVTVSDQWWLDGGIVYAYDAIEGAAYRFIRFDKAGNNTCKSIPQKISIGTGVDAIKADGFGNLYFAKTTMEPPLASNVGWPELYTFNFYQIYGGRAYAHAYYRQRVFKTVFCQEIGATGNYQVGKIHIGNNIFRRSFNVPQAWYTTVTLANIQTKANDPGWVWQGGMVQTTAVTDPNLTQLGVINVATPPNPTGNGEGLVDIVGIEDVNPSFKFATDEVNQGMYKFRVENAPYWEGRNNIATDGKTKWEGDKNNNGHFGGFISSVMNTSASVDSSPQVLYTWRIYKIQDAFGTPVAPVQLVKEFVDTPSSALNYYFRSGTYQIMCSAKFKWYDYNTLPFGSTVEDINDCIRPASGMKQSLAAPKDPAINATVFPGLVLPIPDNTAVTMLKVNRQVPPPTGKKLDIQRKVASNWDDPKVFGASKYHVVNEDEVNTWRLKPDPKDPANKYLQDLYTLPVITNNNMVPNTLVWQNNMAAQYEWTLSLTLPDGTVYPAQELSKNSYSQFDATIDMAQEFPTDPVMGKLLCKAYRNWEYLENVYDDNGNYVGQEKREGKIEYSGEVDVLVLDKTPPRVVAVNNRPITATSILDPALLGQTGGLAVESHSIATYTNPASFSILVEDNNIYANMNLLAPVAPADRQHNRGTKQQATFYFERGAGKTLFPNSTGTAAFKYYSSPGAGIVPDITAAWTKHSEYKVMRKPLPYKSGDTSSYVLYVFEVADLKHLQDGTAGDIMNDPARWPINMANNSPNYMGTGAVGAVHPGYGLMFQPTDSSGQVGVRTHFGNVWVIDTLLPMVYSKTTDYIKSFEETQPFGIENYLTTHPKSGESGFPSYGAVLTGAATWQIKPDGFPWYGRLPNDISVWTVQADGKYPGLNDLLGIPPGLNAKMGLYHPPIIQEGVEMFMEVFAADNIAVSNTVLPTINIQGPSGLYTEGDPAKINENAGVNQKIRLLMQKSGVYDVTLTAEDNALDFLGQSKPNRRTVRFGIVVGPTTMEIRVIDKKNTGL